MLERLSVVAAPGSYKITCAWRIDSQARLRLRESVRQRGQTSSAPTWRFSRGQTFFSVEVLPLRGLVTYYVMFFIHLESRKVEVSGITPHPNERRQRTVISNRQASKESC